jgi:FG-GAP repeat
MSHFCRGLILAGICSAASFMMLPERSFAATYTFTQTFLNPTPAPNDFFGNTVAISGQNVLIGAPGDDSGATDTGAAYLFDSVTGNLLQSFFDPTPDADDAFGSTLAIFGNTVLIGEPDEDDEATNIDDAGAAYLFDATTGNLLKTFADPTPEERDRFGISVAIFGNTALIGELGDDSGLPGSGAAYLFDISTGNLLQTFLDPKPAIDDFFGSSVALLGNSVLIGAPQIDTQGADTGAAFLFDATSGNLLQTFLNPSPVSSDFFGAAVTLFGDRALIGAPQEDSGGVDTGAAFLFDTTTGSLLQSFFDPTPEPLDRFGLSVALSEEIALIGELGDDSGLPGSGAVYLFDAKTGELLQTFLDPEAENDGRFGISVALSGNTGVIGELGDESGEPGSGAAFLLERSPSTSVPEPGTISAIAMLGLGWLLKQKVRSHQSN